ncbi:type II toxin-antitoxin system YafQ family toxin [Verminephrobacter eiseniae]|uniref:type II toxin-antitoxin system YafQ family toxin n=1 Tax=Verminephrobacter eiseniae TaxID=364317 RepID=UPI00223806CB|nr:type II toxin-antitoxin system YafQ family toxin [Verminephrobacter eiseniae]MCW5235843.1 type II toxin-antitoxin system YafQ family toxin [Verminephrobacter eiseniae]
MRKIERTTAFRRDFKRECQGPHRAVLDTDLKQIIEALANDVPLAAKHRDHFLTGNWKDYRDCHVRPDLVLIYRRMDGDDTGENPARLILARLGSHSELDL